MVDAAHAEPDDVQYFRRGYEHLHRGRYAAALQDFANSFACNAGGQRTAVQRSFVVSGWAEPAKKYAPARRALLEVRGALIVTLQATTNTDATQTFNDIASINQFLPDLPSTYRLFLNLRQARPSDADQCARWAIGAMVAMKDYQLARTYMLDPMDAVARIARRFEGKTATIRSNVERRALAHVIIASTLEILDTVYFTDGPVAAYDLMHTGTAAMHDVRFQRNVRRGLRGQIGRSR